MFNVSIYKLIKKLTPIELFEIVTMGVCNHHLDKIKKQIVSIRGERALHEWIYETKLDVLDLYLSDNAFSLHTTREEAEKLKEEFKSWNLFHEVFSRWYGGEDHYVVGFNYTQEAFHVLYKEWLRNKNLEILL
jgi:hypothetical protein